MAWYDNIVETTKGNAQKLGDILAHPVDAVTNQLKQGALYKNREALAALLHGDTAPIMAKLNEKSPANPMEAVNFGLGIAPLGITAYHGSPYQFEKFDLSKVGSGEGNQNYGYGIYAAEHPQVAGTYKMPSRGVEATAANHLRMYKTPEKAIEVLQDKLHQNITDLGRQHTQNAIDLIKSGKASTGNLYTIDIADEAIPKMMDWFETVPEEMRKPLSEKAMQQWGSGMGGTGKDLYKEITQNFRWAKAENPEKEASNWFLQHGIQGIRYPDAGSRGMERTGTNNYVVFDPNTIKILNRE